MAALCDSREHGISFVYLQVRDLEQKVELLQEDRNKKYNTNDSGELC